jgi:hypothetical protein
MTDTEAHEAFVDESVFIADRHGLLARVLPADDGAIALVYEAYPRLGLAIDQDLVEVDEVSEDIITKGRIVDDDELVTYPLGRLALFILEESGDPDLDFDQALHVAGWVRAAAAWVAIDADESFPLADAADDDISAWLTEEFGFVKHYADQLAAVVGQMVDQATENEAAA